jgi:cell division septum initiation protein DivIVA
VTRCGSTGKKFATSSTGCARRSPERSKKRAGSLRNARTSWPRPSARPSESPAEAHERQTQLVSRHALIRQAKAAAEEITDGAHAREQEIRLGAKDYADEILNTLELNLAKVIATIQRARDRLHRTDEHAEHG